MPLAPSLPCADLSGPNCPCALGLAGQCVYCTRLRGESRCACDWAGSCVLLSQPASRAGLARDAAAGAGTGAGPPAVPEPARPVRTRRLRLGRIVARSEPSPGVVDLRMAVSPRVSSLLRRPGCFLFVRPPGPDDSHNTPLTVVEGGIDTVRLVFQVAGPKTQAIARVPAGGNLAWKGPYHNALLGASALRRALRRGPGTAVILARGMGQIVAVPLLRLLTVKGWTVDACLDPRGKGGGFARRELERALGRRACEVRFYSESGRKAVLAKLACRSAALGDRPALLVSCGTDPLHRWVASIRHQHAAAVADRDWAFVATNNSPMACGEGTCGACTVRFGDGGRVRACKADIPPELLFGGGGMNDNGRARD